MNDLFFLFFLTPIHSFPYPLFPQKVLALEASSRGRDGEEAELRKQAEGYQAEIQKLRQELSAKSEAEEQVRTCMGIV